ncbi:ABC transporter ATP-binding protein [Devosia chinhatensis]|uniref:Nickel ABC transporter ATP-binding protein n=1 Tax=Devosia chinhatensis TaxID=429727 RepID=A0A0F5FN75_9HYPH|nr:ATP-binding cassette domain-containing protein [Devosia chinhatensis]KKB10278.1 nickel ABC transporter ATP-binding protein [Devosia chinhatensis]
MLEARDIQFSYHGGRRILERVSLILEPGQVLGLAGPSGCGKSTLGMLIAGHLEPDAGKICVDGQHHGRGWCPVQYVHQSPIATVDPRWRIGRIVEEGWEPDEETRSAIGVSKSWYDRFPHEISGGELQRVVLLRAMAPSTRYLVADELTAMLDPITQANIWRYLLAQCRKGLGVIAISHDRQLIDRVATRRYTLTDRGLTDVV